jgi:hypothetical protein
MASVNLPPTLTTATLSERATMAEKQPITIPIDFPSSDYPRALAQFVKRVDYETVRQFADKRVTYGGHAEVDVMWSALRAVDDQLAEAGFSPR